MKTRWIVVLIIVLFFIDLSFGQCAMCKANVESNMEEEVSFGRTINTGIMMLMITPYIILFLLFRKKIRAGFNALFKG